MNIVHIIGGLGNQMFQYAFAYAYGQNKQCEVKLDITDFDSYQLRKYELNVFSPSLSIATEAEINSMECKQTKLWQRVYKKLRQILKKIDTNCYIEPHFYYDKTVYALSGDIYFKGYWQSEKYFIKYRDSLLKEFSPQNSLHKDSNIFLQKILKCNSVSVHIRRGDYVSNDQANQMHGTCPVEYYQQAYKLLTKKIDNPYFFIFSDDLEWAKEHLSFMQNTTFVNISEDVPDYEEMILMSRCQHNIIANSSFSWWGAWLNQNPDKIIVAPKIWFKNKEMNENTQDLIPPEWIRL